MSIDIISLTEDKGIPLSHSVRHDNDIGWRVIYFLRRMGNTSTRDKITTYCFAGNVGLANSTISKLKSKGIVR